MAQRPTETNLQLASQNDATFGPREVMGYGFLVFYLSPHLIKVYLHIFCPKTFITDSSVKSDTVNNPQGCKIKILSATVSGRYPMFSALIEFRSTKVNSSLTGAHSPGVETDF